MAFLLFAARKLQLKREINAKNYELMTISSKYATITNQVGQKQEAINNIKNQVSNIAGNMNSIFQNNAIMSNFNAADQAKIQSGNFNGIDMSKLNAAVNLGSQLGSTAGRVFENVANQLCVQAEQRDLKQLQQIQQQLDLRKQAIESELSLITNEYQSVVSAEKEAAKSAAPQFGLA